MKKELKKHWVHHIEKMFRTNTVICHENKHIV